MKLDFTKLHSLGNTKGAGQPTCAVERVTGGEGDTNTPVSENATQSHQTPYKTLLQKTEAQRIAHEKALAVFKQYQDNRKAAEILQTDVLKGVARGDDVYTLLLKAAKAISLMTNEPVFYQQIEANIRAVYGVGLGETTPLTMELQAVQERLTRLTRTALETEPPDSRARIERAVVAHRDRVGEIEKLLGR